MIVRDNIIFSENNAVFLFKMNNASMQFRHLNDPLQFDRVLSKSLSLNLQMIDSKLPEILAIALYYSATAGTTIWPDIIQMLSNVDPLRIKNKSDGFYKLKITQFLLAITFGLNENQVYQGVSNDQIFIYNEKLDAIKYHQMYDRDLLIEFLLTRTRLINVLNFGDLFYEENENYYIKFNLRIEVIPSTPQP